MSGPEIVAPTRTTTAPGPIDTGPGTLAPITQVTPAPICSGPEPPPLTVVVQPPTVIDNDAVALIAGASASVT